MWVVKRCVQDFDEVFRNEVAQFTTEQAAQEFAEAKDRSHSFYGVWHEVEEE
jgi:hypothetical protein